MKRIGLLAAGLVISIVSLYYAFQGFNLASVWDAVAQVQYIYLLLMIVPYVLTFMTKVWRWRDLFHPDESRFSTGLLFSSLMISYVPLPFRLGEVARAVVVSARSNTPVARVFSTIFVEKVLDVLTLLLFMGISLQFVPLPQNLHGSATALGVVVIVLTVATILLALRPELARSAVRLLSRWLPSALGVRLQAITDQVLAGLAPLSEPIVATKLGLWSLATWSVNAIAVYLLLEAFNISLPPMGAVMVVVATNLGMAVPSAPGYIGTFELVVVAVLGVLGIPREQAQAFAIVYHFIGLVPVAIMGAIALVQQGLGLTVFSPNARGQAAPVTAPGSGRDKP